MAIERTLAIIKPDGMKHKEEILRRINNAGLKIVRSKVTIMKPEAAAKFYKHIKQIKGEKIFQNLVDYMTSSPIMPLVIGGENAISVLRKLTGFTDPERAEKGTIRGDLGTDKMRIANSENRSTKNIIHASGTVEEAKNEIKFFF